MIALTLSKSKFATTTNLKQSDYNTQVVDVVYASKWIVSAALIQEHDNVYWPVL